MRAVSRGRRHHGAPDVRRARLRAGALVSRARRQGRVRRAARAVVSGRVRAARRRARDRRRRAALGPRFSRDVERGRCRPSIGAAIESPIATTPRRAATAAARQLSHDHEPDRDARLPQPLRLLLSLDRRPAHALPDARRRADRRQSSPRTVSPTRVFIDNNLGSRPDYLRALCRALRPLEKIWSAAVSIDVTDDPSLVREMALAGCTGVFIGFESLHDENIADAQEEKPAHRRLRAPRRDPARQRHSGERQLRARLRPRPSGRLRDARPNGSKQNRLECATFHILTPYPGTPLFAQMEREGRLLHQGLDPVRHGSRRVPAEAHVARGTWRRAMRGATSGSFSHARSGDVGPPIPRRAAVSRNGYLYKRSNRFWYYLIRYRLTGLVWRPLVEWTRIRHIAFRGKLSLRKAEGACRGATILPAGV